MMLKSFRSKPSTPLQSCVSGAILSLVLLTPPVVLAHSGHGDEFQAGSELSGAADSIQVDADTAKRIGVKVEPVKSQRLAVGIKTTGQIETLPNKQVEVTTPISGTKVVELLVEPGAKVIAGQPVAVLTAADLVELRVNSQEKRAEAQADLQQAQANLKLAQQNYQRYVQIAAAEIAQAQSQIDFAQEKSDKDQVLLAKGAIPRRQALESQTQLAQAKAGLTSANSRRDVIEAEAELKRAQAAVTAAQSRLSLSDTAYQTRLQQLGTKANAQGQVTVTSPISGRVADREVTPGQAFEDAGGKLMTIVNDSRVYATANIYEKDLNKVKNGQPVSAKVASTPNQTFTGRIAVIGSVVEGETRVVPVKAQIDNSTGVLKPGMFAELDVLTNRTPKAILAIPSAALVEANGKQTVYVQNGNAYQAVEVTLGQTSGDMVEVKSGLFEGDLIVTQRAPQLYAQSLRSGSNTHEAKEKEAPPQAQATKANSNSLRAPWWLIGAAGGGVIAITAFAAGAFWSGRRKTHKVTVYPEPGYVPEQSSNAYSNSNSHHCEPDDCQELLRVDKFPPLIDDNHHLKSQEVQARDRK